MPGTETRSKPGTNLILFTQWVFVMLTNGNNPLAGSPMETLLRLLLPLNDQVWSTFPHPLRQWNCNSANPKTSINHSIASSEVCTKGRDVINVSWWLVLTRNSSFMISNYNDQSPSHQTFNRLSTLSVKDMNIGPEHLRESQTCYCFPDFR